MNMKNFRSILLLMSAVALGACEKDAVQQIGEPVVGGARIRFFNFGLGAPAVNFYADNQKVTAVSSTTGVESTNGVAYGAVGVSANGYYSLVDAGQHTLSGRISATVDKDLAISNLSATLVDDTYYSFYQSGVYNTTTKTVDSFIVVDDIPEEIRDVQADVRFVNAIYNSQPMTLYARNTVTGVETAIGDNVAYRAAGAFTTLPAGSYDLFTRVAGSATNVITRTAVAFENRRVYTISARGDMTVTGTTATNRPILDNTPNR